jgi:microcystin-dependent protein
MDGFIGEIRIFAGKFAPQGWMFCDGSVLQIARYTPLFSILGPTYGGNGTSTFALPDLTERTPIKCRDDDGDYTLGNQGGEAFTRLTDANMPPHTHSLSAKIRCNTGAGNTHDPKDAYPANTKIGDGEYNKTHDGTYMAADVVSLGHEQILSNNTGFSNMQQFLAVNFIICVNGEFPVRP